MVGFGRNLLFGYPHHIAVIFENIVVTERKSLYKEGLLYERVQGVCNRSLYPIYVYYRPTKVTGIPVSYTGMDTVVKLARVSVSGDGRCVSSFDRSGFRNNFYGLDLEGVQTVG